MLREELPRYRSITTVTLGDDANTSFWQDKWLLDTTIRDTFPALFSHCTRPEISVRDALATSALDQFRPHLSYFVEEEKRLLLDCLSKYDSPLLRTLAILRHILAALSRPGIS
jgi:hypothetical protein